MFLVEPRVLSGLVALVLLLAGVGTLVAQRAKQADAQQTFTIEISAGGFNPAICTMNRNYSTVFFKNNDTEPHRVVVPLLPVKSVPASWPAEQEFRLDTGVIPPGGTSESGWFTNQVDDFIYYDYDDPTTNGRIIVPLSNDASSNCSPQAGTPTPTATPVATVPPGRGYGCDRYPAVGCVFAILVASEPLQ